MESHISPQKARGDMGHPGFYNHFRTDSDSPARVAQIGTFTPVLHHDESNLAAASSWMEGSRCLDLA